MRRILALALSLALGAAVPQKTVIERTIRDSIDSALTKDRAFLGSTLVQDERLFIFNPTPDTVMGWKAFQKGSDFWMDPRFKAAKPDIRALRIDLSRAGDVAWWSCLLDNLGEWEGRPIGGKDTRCTGVLERRDGKWRIAQMHFSFAQACNPVSIAFQVSGPFKVRSYLIWDEKSREAALVDPGTEVDQLLATLEAKTLKLKYVLLTHAHQDHVASLPALRQRFPKARLAYTRREFEDFKAYAGWRTLFDGHSVAKWTADVATRALMDGDFDRIPAPDLALEEPQALRLGLLPIQVLLTPGHSRGSATFALGNHLFCGDLLLFHGAGFIEYPLCSREGLVTSIRRLYATFPDEAVLHAGHGADSTIGAEKRQNRNVTETEVKWAP